jgi:hypothetical protein
MMILFFVSVIQTFQLLQHVVSNGKGFERSAGIFVQLRHMSESVVAEIQIDKVWQKLQPCSICYHIVSEVHFLSIKTINFFLQSQDFVGYPKRRGHAKRIVQGSQGIVG